MYASNTDWGRNGVKRVRLEPVNSSLQQNGSHKSLLERLKSDDGKVSTTHTSLSPEEPQYVDITAAFFGKQRRPAQHSKGQMGPPPLQQQKRPQPRNQDVQRHETQHKYATIKLAEAKVLRDELAGNIATESRNIYSNGLTQLKDLHEALKGIMTDTDVEDDRVLALVESNHKRMAVSPSETTIAESSTDDDGNTTRREFHIGQEVASLGDYLNILESQVKRLWDDWEAADREVQAKVAEMTGSTHLLMSQSDCIKDVRESLAREMKAFDAEAEGTIEDSREEARMCEKEFGRKIHGAMSALLQQFLLED
ncbi:hypothetical protein N8I77_002018 [Diaporthe amygdali]|uniref:Uncharacterized protein n=1 Tax=Phomopsis amygdali TaxID=1214568 RepID=A0AAD9SRU2_PHOAM|nr:hypothetical protein N8I77_002018 [Diaporthe amygdali]